MEHVINVCHAHVCRYWVSLQRNRKRKLEKRGIEVFATSKKNQFDIRFRATCIPFKSILRQPYGGFTLIDFVAGIRAMSWHEQINEVTLYCEKSFSMRPKYFRLNTHFSINWANGRQTWCCSEERCWDNHLGVTHKCTIEQKHLVILNFISAHCSRGIRHSPLMNIPRLLWSTSCPYPIELSRIQWTMVAR